MTKVEITVTDELGEVQKYQAAGTLFNLVWDAFLIAEYQDEQWSDIDTANLIVQKLKGKSPIQHFHLKN